MLIESWECRHIYFCCCVTVNGSCILFTTSSNSSGSFCWLQSLLFAGCNAVVSCQGTQISAILCGSLSYSSSPHSGAHHFDYGMQWEFFCSRKCSCLTPCLVHQKQQAGEVSPEVKSNPWKLGGECLPALPKLDSTQNLRLCFGGKQPKLGKVEGPGEWCRYFPPLWFYYTMTNLTLLYYSLL